MSSRIADYAKKTFIALKNPFGSVEKVYPAVIDKVADDEQSRYLGIKNVHQIPKSLLQTLAAEGYHLHTLDKASQSGRAVDVGLINPITGGPMSGSSSGTALNVFLGINDLGVGTDGGGSVLAPAMTLNCFGFISPLLESEHMQQFSRRSTDDITFFPSLGFVARDWVELERAVRCTLAPPVCPQQPTLLVPDDASMADHPTALAHLRSRLADAPANCRPYTLPAFDHQREPMLAFLKETLPNCDVLVEYESKIDIFAMGDSIFGHYDPKTLAKQNQSGKYLIRVANMAGATALCVPDTALGSGFVLLCESKPSKIAALLATAQRLCTPTDQLTRRYFDQLSCYFPVGYGEG